MVNQRKAGATLSYVATFLQIIIGFVYIPLLLKLVTQSEYGLYATMGSFVAYMAIMDLGLSGTLTRYLSRELESGDVKRQQNILAIGSRIYAVIAVLTVAVGIAMYFLIEPIYGVRFTAQELITGKQMFLIMIVNTGATIGANMFTSIISAYERFWFDKLLIISKSVLQPLVIILWLMQVPNVLYIVVVQTVFNIAVIAIKIYYCKVKIKARVKLHHWDKPLVKEMTRFALFIFINMITTMIYWNTDQLILGAVAGTSVVAVYAISARLEDYFRTFSSAISNVFLPKISRLSYASEDMTQINRIFIRVGRIQFLIMFLVLTGFIIFGKLFLGVWVGDRYTDAYYFCVVIMIPLFIPLIQNVGISVLQAKNKHSFRSIVLVGIALVNVAVSIPLAKAYGGMGCAVATGVSLFIGQGIVLNIYYSRIIGLDIKAFFAQIIKMALPLLGVGVAGYVLFDIMGAGGLTALFVGIFVYMGGYMGVAYLFSMDQYERDLFTGMIRRVLVRKGKRND